MGKHWAQGQCPLPGSVEVLLTDKQCQVASTPHPKPDASQLQGSRPPASAALLLFLSPVPVRTQCTGHTQTLCTRAYPGAHAHEGTHTDLGQQVRAPQAQGRHAGPWSPVLTWEGS